MGWSGGVALFDQVLDVVIPVTPPVYRPRVVQELIPLFEDYDADTWDESKYCERYADAFRAAGHDFGPDTFE